MADVTMDNALNQNSFWDFKGQADYVDSWFYMGKPYGLLLTVSLYLLFVLRSGPVFMSDRPAFTIRKVLLVYNTLQVFISIFLVCMGMKFILRYGIFHKTCLFEDEEVRKHILSNCYWYVLAKLTELLDTVFFVLRKKENQVSFLHVYHHTFTLVMSWLLVKYGKTDDLIFVGTLNSFVHIWMYGYYALSLFPEIARFLWWKKYLTSMQLVQFVIVFIQFVVNNIVSSCPPSKLLLSLLTFNTCLFLYLFSDFYNSAYGNKQKEKQSKAKNEDLTNYGLDPLSADFVNRVVNKKR